MSERMSDADVEGIRQSMSTEGRQVIALERISDQLALIAGALVDRAAVMPKPGVTSRPAAKVAGADKREWENEGDSLAAILGI